jgi:hypothetical protein
MVYLIIIVDKANIGGVGLRKDSFNLSIILEKLLIIKVSFN